MFRRKKASKAGGTQPLAIKEPKMSKSLKVMSPFLTHTAKDSRKKASGGAKNVYLFTC
jgi:hypothetical protein